MPAFRRRPAPRWRRWVIGSPCVCPTSRRAFSPAQRGSRATRPPASCAVALIRMPRAWRRGTERRCYDRAIDREVERMTARAVRIELPEDVFELVQERATRSQRTIEDEVVDVIAGAVQDAERLPPELEDELASLALLDDERLWRAAKQHLSLRSAKRLERL